HRSRSTLFPYTTLFRSNFQWHLWRIDVQNTILWIFALAALAQNLVAPPTDGWPKSGGNLFNQNYSALTQINRQNIAGLKAVWRADRKSTRLNSSHQIIS